jgi:hypothetical protein
MTHRPGKSCRKTGTKGQPDGFAIKSKTGKPWVAEPDRKTCYAAGQAWNDDPVADLIKPRRRRGAKGNRAVHSGKLSAVRSGKRDDP